MAYTEPIDVWRMSASRPWHLEATHDALIKHLKYSGELRFHLIESVLVEELSAQCIHWAKYHGYKVHRISPAKGQGFAMDYALKEVITSKYALKWEDDFKPRADIPLDTCVALMEAYQNINQICFNKRETMSGKYYYAKGGIGTIWPKEQREFSLDGKVIPLVVKEKWWFGTAIWRPGFIRPLFRWFKSNTHNLMNDLVFIPIAREGSKSDWRDQNNFLVPTPKDIEAKVGCYIYGRHGDPPMVDHIGVDDSIWGGQFQKKMAEQGKVIIGV